MVPLLSSSNLRSLQTRRPPEVALPPLLLVQPIGAAATAAELQWRSDFSERRGEGHFRKVAKEVEQALFKKAMPPRPSDPAERIGHELRQQEIRSELRKLDAQQRLTVYLTSTDAEVLDAIEMAPPALVKLAPGAQPVFQPFLDQAKKAVAMVERARVLAPEKAAQLDAFNSLAEVYALAVGGLRGEILAAVPSAQPEAIRVLKEA